MWKSKFNHKQVTSRLFQSGKTKFFYLVLLGFITFQNLSLAQWSIPISISPGVTNPTLNEYMASCLATGGNKLHVVWCDHRTAGNSIFYTQSLDSGFTWSTPVPITDTTGNATWPAIAASGSFVHVVWFGPLLGQQASFYKRSVDGGATWGATVVLDSVTKFWPGISASDSIVAVSLNKEVVIGNTEVFLRVSTNNGASWQPIQQISNANGRSEDPCVAVLGSHIHLSWNDKRSGTMLTYYRHSPDVGATWGSELALSTIDSYGEMVSLSGSYVDVPHGVNTGVFNMWLAQSSDTGNTFAPDAQVPLALPGSFPSWMVRDSMTLHLLYGHSGVLTYIRSCDGGASWETPVSLHHGGLGYCVLTGNTLNVIYTDSSKVHFLRNPTANICFTTAIENSTTTDNDIMLYPNPTSDKLFIETKQNEPTEIILYDIASRKLLHQTFTNTTTINTQQLAKGMYLYTVRNKNGIIKNGKVILSN